LDFSVEHGIVSFKHAIFANDHIVYTFHNS